MTVPMEYFPKGMYSVKDIVMSKKDQQVVEMPHPRLREMKKSVLLKKTVNEIDDV